MKKQTRKSLLVFIAAMIFTLALPAMAMAQSSDFSVKVNGIAVDSASNHWNGGKTYVDVAAFSKATGIPFVYDAEKNTLAVNGKDVAFELKNGQPTAYVRTLAEAAGADSVKWDAKTNTVLVSFAGKLVVYGDIVSENAGCILQNRFTVGDGIVFRMRAVNPITGNIAKDAKLQVHLSTGDVLDMHLGTHPPNVPNGDKFWTVKYVVTEDTPKGTLNYYVTAESGDMKGEFHPFNSMPSLITIIDDQQAGDTKTEQAAN